MKLGLGCTTSQTIPPPKFSPFGRQLATMALKIKTVTIPKGGLVAWQKLSPNLGCQCIWAELHETGGLSATLAVHRLGRCRATRPWYKQMPTSITQTVKVPSELTMSRREPLGSQRMYTTGTDTAVTLNSSHGRSRSNTHTS